MSTFPPPVYDDQETVEDYEEPEDAAVRHQLGLRPIAYPSDGGKGSHPDQRPCPPWCWVGQHDEYDHEVDPDRPMTALHSHEISVATVASCYQGDTYPVGSERFVTPATVETSLRQIGQDAPTIRVALRQPSRDPLSGFSELLMLTVEDAEDLITSLQYQVNQANGTV